MKRIIGLTALLIFAAAAWAQPNNPSVRDTGSDPTGNTCSSAAPILRYSGTYYGCNGSSVYAALAGAPVGGNFYAASYGVLANTKFVTDATTSNTSQTVTCPNSDCAFVSGDVGKIVFGTTSATTGTVIVPQGTITAVNNANSIVVSIAATGSATATAVLIWGSDDSAALTTAWAASSGACGTLVLPAGNMLVQSAQLISNTNPHCNSIAPPWVAAGFYGVNVNGTIIIPTPNFNFSTCTGGSGHTCFGGTPSARYHDFEIWGGGNSLSGVNLGGAVFLEIAQSTGLYQWNIEGWGAASTNSTCLLIDSTQSGDYQGGVQSCGYVGTVFAAGTGTFGCGSSSDSYYGPGGNGIAIDVKSGACFNSKNDNFNNLTVDAGGYASLFGSNTANAGSLSISGVAHLKSFFGKTGGTLTVNSGGFVDAASSFDGGYTVNISSGGSYYDLGANKDETLSCAVGSRCYYYGFPPPTYDDFTRANGAVGSPWSIIGSAASALQISSNKAVCASSDCSLQEYLTPTYIGPNQHVEVSLRTVPTGTDQASIYARMSTTGGNPNLYDCTYNSGTGLLLYKAVAGSYTQLGSTLVVTPAAGDILQINAVGTVITCQVGSNPPIRVVDSAVTSGVSGVALYGAGKTGALGPFIVTPIQ